MSSSFKLGEVFRNYCVVSIPTKTNFRGIQYREAFLFRGSAGWSEFSPFLEYGAEESARWLSAAIEGAYTPWPELHRHSIAINATLPRIPAEQVATFLENYSGCTTIKMKVDNFESDADRLEAVLDCIPDAKIRLDVNGGWSLGEARTHLYNYFMQFGNVFEYVEQPCSSLEDLAILKSEIPIKIAADESIRKFIGSDFSDLKNIADIAIIKWAPSGGMSEARKLIDSIGLPAVISSAVDTAVGISHGLALAASLPQLDYACGLGTTVLLTGDVVSSRPIPVAGELDVGLVEPEPELLQRYAADSDRVEWWENRVTEIWNSYVSQEVKSWAKQ